MAHVSVLPDLAARFAALTPPEKAAAAAHVGHVLTIFARGLFHDYPNDARALPLLERLNELNHTLTQQTQKYIEGRDSWPDDVFLAQLAHQTEATPWEQPLLRGMEEALERAGRLQ